MIRTFDPAKLKALDSNDLAVHVLQCGCEFNLKIMKTIFILAGFEPTGASSRITTLQNHNLIEKVPGKKNVFQATELGMKRDSHVKRLDGLVGRASRQRGVMDLVTDA